MDFSLNEEQTLLRDSVARYVADHGSVERHRRLSNTELGFDPLAWQQFAELGWLALPFAEAVGGIGGGPVELMLVTEELGRGLVREPFLATVVTCGGLLRRATPAQQAAWIPGIIDGSRQWALALAERGTGYHIDRAATVASEVDGGYRLDGHKVAVLNGHCADYLLVSAVLEGRGLSLFAVSATVPGLRRETFRAADGSGGANLFFDGVWIEREALLGAPGDAATLLQAALDETFLAIGAECLGACQVLLDATVDYSKTRQQFGQPIGKFQALQHRMADMYLKLEELRSLVLNAAIGLSEGAADASRDCAALKVKVAEAGRFISQQAVQLHGGIGMTDELVVGHHFKRLMLLARLYGDGDFHLERYSRLAA